MADKSLGFSITAVDRAADTFIRLSAQVERLSQRLDALDRKRVNVPVDVDTSKATRRIETLDKSFGSSTVRVAQLGRAMQTLALPGALIAGLPAVASLGASAVTATGALWLLPAAGLAAGAAIGTLAVGFANVTDALGPAGTPAQIKAVEAALAKLSPAARATVTEIRGLGPAWASVRLDVQEKLFAGMAQTVSALATRYLPVLKAGMGGIAVEFNRSAAALAAFLNRASTVRDISAIFAQVRVAMAAMAPAAANIAAAFVDIAAVGSTFLPGLAGGFTSASAAAAAFVANARGTGQLAVWIQNGLDVLAQLGALTRNVGSILGSVFGAAARSGESFLSILVRVTGQLAAGLKTPAGSAALQQFFTTVTTLVGLLFDKVVTLWPAIAAGAGALAALLVAAAPLSNVLFQLVVAALVPMLDAIKFLAPVLGPLIPIFLAVTTATRAWARATAAVTAVMGAYRTAVAIATAAQIGWQLAMGTNLVLTESQTAAVAANSVVTRLAGAAAATWAAAQWVVAAAQNGTLLATIRMNAAVAAALVVQGIAKGATAAWAATQWLLNAALTANPIGIVVVAIAALVAGLVYAWNNSETFRKIVIGAWEAIKATAVAVFGWLATNIPAIWNGIVNAITTAWNGVVNFFSTIIGAVVAAFQAFGAGVMAAVAFVLDIPAMIVRNWDTIVAFFASLPQKIVAALGFLAGFLLRTAIDGWVAFTTGLEQAWTTTAAFFASLPGRIGSFLLNLGVTLLGWAVSAWTSFTAGLEQAWTGTVAFFTSLPSRVGTFLVNLGATLLTAAVTAWTAFTSGLEQAWTGTVAFFTSLPARVGTFLSSLGAALLTWAITAWAGFTSGLESGWTGTVAWFVALPGRIGAFFAAAGTWLLQVGTDLVLGLWNGLVTAWTTLVTWIAGLIVSFIDGFKAGFGIASPSTIFAEIGMWLIQGLITGLQTALAGLWAVITTITTGLVNLFMTGIGFLADLWSAFWAGLQAAAQTAWIVIQTVVQTGWTLIQTAFNTAIGFLTGLWSAFWNGLVSLATTLFNGVLNIVNAVWTGIQVEFQQFIALVSTVWSAFWNGLVSLATTLFNGVLAVVSAVWNGITAAFNAAIAFLTGVWSTFWNGLQAVASAVWAAVQGVVQAGWTLIQNVFSSVTAFLSGLWSAWWNGLQAVGTAVFSAIQGFIASVWAAIQNVFTTVTNFLAGAWSAWWSGLQSVAVSVWGAISSFLTNAFNVFSAFFSSVWNAIVAFFTTTWNNLRNTATTVWNAIAAFFNAAFAAYQAFFTNTWNAISAFFTNIWNVLRNTATTVWNAIAAFFNAAFAAFQNFFATVWNTISAFFTGIWNALRATATNAWNAINAFFVGAFAAFSNFFATTWNNIVATFDRIWSGIVAIAQRVWGAVRGAFVGGVNAIIDVINGFAGAINKVAGLLGFTINLGIPRLADGGQIDAIRRSLGGTVEMKQVIRRADGGYATGQLPGYSPGVDTLPALAGNQPYLLAGGEYIVRPEATRAMGPQAMSAINNAHRNPVGVGPAHGMPGLDGGPHLNRGGPIGLAAGGQTWQQLDGIRRQMFPGSVLTSALRPGASDYHGRGEAIDIGVGGNAQSGLMPIAAALARRYPNSTELIHNPNGSIKNGRPAPPSLWGAATWAAHANHVHWAMTPEALGGGGGGIGGAISGVIGAVVNFLRDQANALLNPLRDKLIPIRDNQGEGFGKRMVAGAGLKLIDQLFSKADEQDAAQAAANAASPIAGGAAPPGQISAWISQALGILGFPQSYAAGIYQQIQTESGGNPRAIQGNIGDVNNRSGDLAKGIMQVIGATFRANALPGHGDIFNPVDNIIAGSRYALGRYGAGWFAPGPRHSHGYDDGGLATGRGVMFKDILAPERTLSPRQTVSFERLVGILGDRSPDRLVSDRVLAAVTRAAPRGGPAAVSVDVGSVVSELTGLRGEVATLQRVIREARPVNVYPRNEDTAETGRAVALQMRLP